MRKNWMQASAFLVLLGLLSGCSDRPNNDVKTREEAEALVIPEMDVNMWNSASTYITLKSQAQVDAFDCNTPVLEANLVIGDVAGSDISDISRLGCIAKINGLLQIHGTQLRDLSGLQRLRSVKSGIQIDQNAQLLSLRGLDALDSLGGYLYISNNDQLGNLEGLRNLRHIDALAIFDNDRLGDLTGLNGVTSIGHAQEWFVNLHIASNNALRSLNGLGGLSKIQGGMWITDNPSLGSLDELRMLDEVTGTVVLRKNGGLEDSEGKPWARAQMQ